MGTRGRLFQGPEGEVGALQRESRVRDGGAVCQTPSPIVVLR